MDKRRVAIANKRRGRAFQTKLAKLTGGANIGTLGGEDVSHEEFSYEAKTYNINAKSKNGREWKGELLLIPKDGGKAKTRFAIIETDSQYFDSIIMLRWMWWKEVLEHRLEALVDFGGVASRVPIGKFIGNTWMDQAERNTPDAKVPVVVVHTTGRRHENDIVLIRKIYWQSLLEKSIDKNF